MIGNRKLVLDTFCEVYDQLKPWADEIFWNLDQHEPISESLYVIGSQQFFKHTSKIKHMLKNNNIKVVFSNPAEGSATIKWKIHRLELFDFIQQGKVLVVSGGDIEDQYRALVYDSFMCKILDYNENLQAMSRVEEIYTKQNKPYKFLFLNGRARYHRKYLLEILQKDQLLQQSLWTNLDASPLDPRQSIWNPPASPATLEAVPVKFLPDEYEVVRYRKSLESAKQEINLTGAREKNTIGPMFNKSRVFGNEWGEIYLQPEPYIDTYFSVVTETVFDYPYSFRTEKIWKPIAMGHPWIAVANRGFYRDLRNLGFATFDGIIDESFDNIDDNQKRIDRIVETIKDLCQQDLASFLRECYNVCKYNQQHLAQTSKQAQQEFPERFFQFVKNNQFHE